MTDKIVVLTTCDSEQRAESLARHLVEARVAACVNIIPKIKSIYRWPDAQNVQKIVDATEFLLLIKSRRDHFPALKAELEKMHSYEVPEIIALPIVEGSEAYLGWLDREM